MINLTYLTQVLGGLNGKTDLKTIMHLVKTKWSVFIIFIMLKVTSDDGFVGL